MKCLLVQNSSLKKVESFNDTNNNNNSNSNSNNSNNNSNNNNNGSEGTKSHSHSLKINTTLLNTLHFGSMSLVTGKKKQSGLE